MADPQFPATPQAFSFAGRALVGFITSFSGTTPRRFVEHEYPKRDGGRAEDMGRGPRTLEVRLQFVGPNAAKDYRDFEQFVDRNPTGTIVHPIAGRWTAFCRGPTHDVDLNRAVNQVEVNVAWIESQLDAKIASDTPDVATATQNVVGQQSLYQQTVATFMGALAKAQTLSAQALNAVDTALNAINSVASAVTAPVAYMQSAINVALGATSSIVGALNNIQASVVVLNQDVTSFVAAVNSMLTSGTDTPPPGVSDQVNTLLGVVQNDVATLESALIAASQRPGSCAYAVADAEILLDYCMTLVDAVQASQPPTTTYTVPTTQNLLVIAQKLVKDLGINRDALTYASAVMGLNRISTPAAVPAGTVLTVPTR